MKGSRPHLAEGLLGMRLVPLGSCPVYRQSTADGLELLGVVGGLLREALLVLTGGLGQLRRERCENVW